MRGLLMIPVALALVAVVTAESQTTTPDRDGKGKSAQRFTTRPADFGDDDNNILFTNSRDRNDLRNFGSRGGSSFVTPNPQRVVTVSTSPGLSVSPGFGRDQILIPGGDPFNNIYSPGFIPGTNPGLGGNVLGGGFLDGGVLGGNVFGGQPNSRFPVTDGYSRYLELLVARDPTILLQSPEILLQYPQLILIRPELALQYPQLQQYINPRLLRLPGSPFGFNNQQGFRRTFPQSLVGSPGHFSDGTPFGAGTSFGGIGGISGIGGLGGIGGLNSIDLQRPIDIGGNFNRPILTTSAPFGIGTINPNRNIRFNKKK